MGKNKVVEQIISFLATDDMVGLRVDKALSLREEIYSRSRAEWLIDQKFVFVNKKNVEPARKIKNHDLIEIYLPEENNNELKSLESPLDVLYEDNDLIVINKPYGLVVHPAAGHSDDTLVNMLVHHTKKLSMKFGEDRPGIVHRLDKDTSGIMVIAKNDFIHEGLAQQFKDRTIHRIYYAWVCGEIKEKKGTIESAIARHPINRKKMASRHKEHKELGSGKWAITHYEVISKENWPPFINMGLSSSLSYIKIKLETGRTHQIRVHFSEMGHPLWRDPIYTSERMQKTMQQEKGPTHRLALHAAELGFIHPRTGQWMMFSIPWPIT